MKEINRAQLAELIKKNDEIAYVATAITPWHAIGVIASILSLKLERKKGIVLVNSHTGRILINEPNFSLISENIEVYTIVKGKSSRKKIGGCGFVIPNILLYSLLGKLRKSSKKLHLITPMDVELVAASSLHYALKDRVICNNVYDEGLATYFPVSHTKRVTKDQGLKIRMKSTFLVWYFDKLCRSLYNATQSFENNCLFVKRTEQLDVNNRIVPFYKTAIEEGADNGTFNKSIFENAVVITPNAWMRKEVTDNADTEALKRLMDSLIDEKIKFVVKLHPRDTWTNELCSEYREHIHTNNSISTENLFASLEVKPKCVIGFSSTTLVTAKLFWNIPAFNMADIVDNANLSKLYIAEKRYFNEIFGFYIDSPKSMDSLIESING